MRLIQVHVALMIMMAVMRQRQVGFRWQQGVVQQQNPQQPWCAYLVLLGDANNGLEVANVALHTVNTLYHHQDLLPWPVRARLAVRDGSTQHNLQACRICSHTHTAQPQW